MVLRYRFPCLSMPHLRRRRNSRQDPHNPQVMPGKGPELAVFNYGLEVV